MYYEIKFDLQIAAQKRVAGNQSRSVHWLVVNHQPQGPNFFVTGANPTPSKRRHDSPFAIPTSRAASQGFLIVTPGLEFPATLTKQSPGRISNRYKLAVFSPGFPAPARNRQESSPPEFLIANLELEFVLSASKSAKYNFLIANKRGFCRRRSGSRFYGPESESDNVQRHLCHRG
jgi:hypothetical protein